MIINCWYQLIVCENNQNLQYCLLLAIDCKSQNSVKHEWSLRCLLKYTKVISKHLVSVVSCEVLAVHVIYSVADAAVKDRTST